MDIVVISPNELVFQGKSYACVVGRGGIAAIKREGDGVTPAGRFALRSLRYRSDRLEKPQTRLSCQAISANDGWCDDPASPAYNKPVNLPFAASHERLWRDDNLYNLIVELGYNDAPPEPDKGSALFFHVKSPKNKPTEGCVALAEADLLEVLKGCGPESFMEIRPQSA